MTSFDPQTFRSNFPLLTQPQVYLDSAATALKPQAMITATQQYYSENSATANRSLHSSAQQTTQQIELARAAVAKLIHADSPEQIVWTKGATESVNLIAQSYARSLLQPGDEIIVSELEHHSNLVPWLIVAEQCGAKVIKWPANRDGYLDECDLQRLMSSRTKLVAVTQMSNVTGFMPNIAEITRITHQYGAVIVVDGAQGIVHQAINVTELDIDFYLFSAHKLYGPTGLGVLYAKTTLLAQMPVWQGGGKMLKTASFSGFEPAEIPDKFEAGTPNIAAIIGFYATLKWLETVDWQAAEQYVQTLADKAEAQLAKLYNSMSYRAPHAPLLSFNLPGIHHSDMALLLAEQNIAVRTGALCAQPLMQALNCSGVIRVSLLPYNNHADIDKLLTAIKNAVTILS